MVSLEAVYQLIGDVYRGCDYFCQAFEERYPSQAALGEEIEAYKAWRRQVESGRSRNSSASATEALAGRCAAPMYLVAVLDEADGQELRLVGFVRLSPSKVPRQGHTADLTMGLAPGAQGQGLGTQLLQLTLERVRSENRALQLKAEASSVGHQGIEIVYLMVREDNRPAISLYRKVGFEQVAVLHKDTKISDDLYYDGIMMRLFM